MHTRTVPPVRLDRLAAFDEVEWAAFDRVYRPVLRAFALKLGLCEPDAEEVSQSSMAAFSMAVRQNRFDPARGSLSSYLFGIARNQMHLLRRRRTHGFGGPCGGGSYWDTVPATNRERAVWDRTWVNIGLKRCVEELRRSEPTERFEAFRMRLFLRMSADEIGLSLGIPVSAVYRYTYQLKHRLRSLMREMADANGLSWTSMP